jgi:hypothetical protein
MKEIIPAQPVAIKQSLNDEILPSRSQKRSDHAGKTKERKEHKGEKGEDHSKRYPTTSRFSNFLHR